MRCGWLAEGAKWICGLFLAVGAVVIHRIFASDKKAVIRRPNLRRFPTTKVASEDCHRECGQPLPPSNLGCQDSEL
jgi:hypothetical protein